MLLYGFPAQIAALKRPIFDFLNQIFEPTRYHAKATLRGFYFTSGTQQGTPIDRLIGALAKSFGAEQIGAKAYSGLGKSFFLTDLILKVIIGEAGWVSFNRAAVRRALILKASLYLTISLVAVTGDWALVGELCSQQGSDRSNPIRGRGLCAAGRSLSPRNHRWRSRSTQSASAPRQAPQPARRLCHQE